MFDRHWDKEEVYKEWDLFTYAFWHVALSTRQHTLGSCVIFCLRPGVWKFSELYAEEVMELIQVHKELEEALHKTFGNRHVNYCQYGNKLEVFHEHVIPRYDQSVMKYDLLWVDPKPTSLPAWSSTDVSDKTLLRTIKEEILANYT